MTYARPPHNQADASWEGAGFYGRPASLQADASWEPRGVEILGTMQAGISQPSLNLGLSARGGIYKYDKTTHVLRIENPAKLEPGAITLQFGRIAVGAGSANILEARLPPPSLPGLTLTATGEVTGTTTTGTLVAQIPAPQIQPLTLTATDQTLSGNLLAELPATSLPMTLSAQGIYILDLPDGAGPALGAPSRNFRASQTPLGTNQQEMERTQTRAAPIQAHALPVSKGHSIRQQQADKLDASRRLPAQHGQKLEGRATTLGHADAQRVRQAFASEHQHGIRLSKSVFQSYAETLKLRAFRRMAEQQSLQAAGRLTLRSRQGAKLELRVAVQQTSGQTPAPGLFDWPPLPPVSTAPKNKGGGPYTLQFCRERNGKTALIFGPCQAPEQPPGETVVIPIREIYTVINTLTVTELNGTPIAAEDFNASIDADSWTWSWNARIPAASLAQVRPDSSTRVELIATINGEPLRVLVEGIQRERRHGESWLRVSGRGRAAFLSDPLAPVTQYTNTSAMTAQQALNATLTTNGVTIGWTIDWQIEDWQIPAGIWSHNGTWIDAAKRIAEAGGAYVQSHDTEQTLRILPRYPTAPWNWPTAIPDVQLPEDVVEVEGIEWAEKPDYNAVWVHGGDQGRADRIIRAGSGGTNPAPTIVDELATDPAMTRQRGLALLGNTGKQADISLRLPILPETGMIRPGTLIEYQEQGNTRRGLVRSLNITHNWPELWQTIGVETHE